MKHITKKELLKITGIPVLIASLCCVSPLVLLLFGIGSVAALSSLTDVLYGSYKWVFRGVGLLAYIIAIVVYFRKKGICTLDQVKRERNKIINTVLITLIIGILAYVIWLYGVVHVIGAFAGLWSIDYR